MKRLWSTLGAALCLLLTAAGAALPFMAARAQDRRIARDDGARALEVADLRLEKPAAVGGALRLAAGHNYNAVTWMSETRMTAAQSAEAALALAVRLRDEGLLPAGAKFSDFDAETKLLVDMENAASAVVWDYICRDMNFQLRLDDATGQLLSLSCVTAGWESGYDADGAVVYAVDPEARMERWAAFCADYYDAELVDVVRRVEEIGWAEFELTLRLPDGGGLWTASLMMDEGGVVIFNE